jgi:hypothetical protein
MIPKQAATSTIAGSGTLMRRCSSIAKREKGDHDLCTSGDDLLADHARGSGDRTRGRCRGSFDGPCSRACLPWRVTTLPCCLHQPNGHALVLATNPTGQEA